MKKTVLFGLVLLIIGGGIWMGRTPYRHWKQKRFLVQAEAFLAKSDYHNAVLSARKTLEISPANVEASRIMARITEQFKFPEALSWRHRILDLEPNVVQNRLDLARTAILLGNYREADQALRGIKESDRNRAEFHEIAALLDVAEQNIPAAEAQAAAAAKLEPQNKSMQLNLAILDVQSRNKHLVDTARSSLEELSADPAFRRDALRQLALAAMRDGNFAKGEALSQQLQLEKPLLFEDQLLNLTILREAKSTNFAIRLASLEKEVATNSQQINALSGWFMGQQMTDEEMRWMLSLPAKTRNEPSVLVALADCYATRRDWARMQSLLADRNWAEVDFLRLALLSRAYREQKNDLAAQVNWHAALTLASGHQQPLATLVRLANAWGWDPEKEEAAWLLIQRFPGERWALELLERSYAAKGNTRGLQKVYSTRMANDAADVLAKNNFAAVSLLLGLRLPEAHQIAQEDYARFPQDAVIASTYAYSLYLQGRTKEGLKLLEKLPEDKLRLPAVATYYGVLLAGAGQPAKAKTYLEIADRSPLLPEEKALAAAARTASSSPK
jgi:Flp pilus assembly protein TadD